MHPKVKRFMKDWGYWFSFMLVVFLIQQSSKIIEQNFTGNNLLVFVVNLFIASTFLAINSSINFPFRQWLNAQFESGDVEESLKSILGEMEELKTQNKELEAAIKELKESLDSK